MAANYRYSESVPVIFSAFMLLLAGASAHDPVAVWSFQFNATMAKINPVTPHIWWTKFYYDYNHTIGGSTRYDFFKEYYPLGGGSWSPVNCSILMSNEKMWFFDGTRCKLDHTGIPTISPWWMSNGTYMGADEFRGLYADHWQLKTGLGLIDYYARAGTDGAVPLRSTNQANDPGATDYFDIAFGPQNLNWFKLPDYCNTRQDPELSCPPF